MPDCLAAKTGRLQTCVDRDGIARAGGRGGRVRRVRAKDSDAAGPSPEGAGYDARPRPPPAGQSPWIRRTSRAASLTVISSMWGRRWPGLNMSLPTTTIFSPAILESSSMW